MIIDISKIKFNWRTGVSGPISAALSNPNVLVGGDITLTYNSVSDITITKTASSSVQPTYYKNDVFYRNGGAYYISDSSNTVVPMALGQQGASVTGSICGAKDNLYGVNNTILHSSTTDLEFRFISERNGTNVKALAIDGMANRECSRGFRGHALMYDGTIRSWGRGEYGSLGSGDTNNRSKPVNTQFPPNTPPIVSIFQADIFSYAIDASGNLWSWGYNGQGNLGIGSTTDTYIPTLVNGKGDLSITDKVVTVALGSGHDAYRCAVIVTDSGKALHVGQNRYGAGGTGVDSTHSSPTETLISKKLRAENNKIVAAYVFGHYHMGSFLIDQNGVLYMAGEQNTIGRLHNNDNPQSGHEIWPPSLTRRVKKVVGSEADYHAADGFQYSRNYAILFEDGGVARWGHNNGYFPYIGSSTEEWVINIDTSISNVTDIHVLSGGYSRYFALKNDGTIWGLGYGGSWNTFLNSNVSANTSWTNISNNSNGRLVGITKLAVTGYYYHTRLVALRNDGKIVAWGTNSAGGNGIGKTLEVTSSTIDYMFLPKPAIDFFIEGANDNDTVAIAALLNDGRVFTVGSGAYGMLGFDDDEETRWTPSSVLF